MVLGILVNVVCALPVALTAVMAVQLTRDLNFGAFGIGAAVGTFFGAMALSSIYLGRAADRLGATLSLRLAALGAAGAGFGIATLSRDWMTLAMGLTIAGMAQGLAQPAANRLLMNRVDLGRLGTAFGLKQTAPPAASMLAGIAVPVIGLTLGWRWAYAMAGMSGLLVAMAVGPRPSTGPVRIPRADRGKPPPLRDRPTLVVLAFGSGLAFAASAVVQAFLVDAAVFAGSPERDAGLAFAAASMTAILTRIFAGMACDRYAISPLRLGAALLATGAGGIGLLAVGQPDVMLIGGIIALGGTWGFNGVFWFALVTAYSATPGRITGTMSPAALGGVIGPVGFGTLVTRIGYSAAWGLTSAVAVCASGAVLIGARRLSSRQTG